MNKREKGLLAPIRIENTIKHLDRLPLHIVQSMCHSKSKDKTKLVSDFATILTELEIELFQTTLDEKVINVMWMDKIIGYIVTNRGKQLYAIAGLNKARTSKEWNHFLRLMVLRKEEVK